MWTLPILIVVATVALSIPIGRYMAKVMDTSFRPPTAWLRWIESRLDTGPQNWKQYAIAMMLFSTAGFVAGYAILAFQPWLPLNPDHKGMLSPSTIFNTVSSFLANTQLQHYSGEVHLSYFSQLFFITWMDYIGPIFGLSCCVAVIRGLRGETKLGNFYVDMWRGMFYVMLPICLVVGSLYMLGGMPMTLEGNVEAATLEAGSMGTNPEGGAQSADHRPRAGRGNRGSQAVLRRRRRVFWSELDPSVRGSEQLDQLSGNAGNHPGAGRGGRDVRLDAEECQARRGDLRRDDGHAVAAALAVRFGRFRAPNPALTAHDSADYVINDPSAEGGKRDIAIPAVAGLPVDQSLGNLEGKELRFGTSAGPTWAVLCTSVANGSVNCMHDSLNPLAGLCPMIGMWINCIFGGVGVGLLNMLVYLIVAVFFSGLMVGRTPEYLGKKIEAREMKLAMLALLIHPILILGPTGLFCLMGWTPASANNPGTHAFSETLYEFSSASANNGSGFEGLGDTYGFNDNPAPAPMSVHWDIATGLVMMLGRYVPMIVPLALAGSVAAKKPTPVTTGTLNTNTFTFGCMLLGTVLLLSALLFILAGVLGPVAEHFGPLPFGG